MNGLITMTADVSVGVYAGIITAAFLAGLCGGLFVYFKFIKKK